MARYRRPKDKESASHHLMPLAEDSARSSAKHSSCLNDDVSMSKAELSFSKILEHEMHALVLLLLPENSFLSLKDIYKIFQFFTSISVIM